MTVTADSLDVLLATGEQPGTRRAGSAGLCRLTGYALLRVTGADARDFLSRQLSCDVGTLNAAHSVQGAWLSAKGRVQALVRLVEDRDAIVMILDQGVAESAVARLRMFVLRSQVSIEPAARLALAGLVRPAASTRTALALPALAGAGASGRWRSLTLVSVSDDASRMLVLGNDRDLVAGCSALLNAGTLVMAEQEWDRLEVEAGAARLDSRNVDRFVPQMLNLDRTGAISFSKGCYPGQEIVARTQHLGRIKRRMFVAQVAAGTRLPQPGDGIHVAAAPEVAIGHVVRSAPAAHGGGCLLAVLPLDAATAGEPLLAGGSRLDALREPPYGFADDVS